MTKPRTWSIELTVVGLQFRWKMDGRRVLRDACPFPVVLEREPDNPVDPNAVKVVIAGDFKLTKLRGKHLGYIRANIAAIIAPRLDAGEIEPVKLWVMDVEPEDGEATLQARFADKPPAKKRKSVSRKKKVDKRRIST